MILIFIWFRNPCHLSLTLSQNMQDLFQERRATLSWEDLTPKYQEDASLRKMNSKKPMTDSRALTLKLTKEASIKPDQISSEDMVPLLN